MNPDFLINGVLSSVLGGGRKRSRRALRYLTGSSNSFWTRPTTLLTAAGVAWGIFETMQKQPGQGRNQTPHPIIGSKIKSKKSGSENPQCSGLLRI